MDLPFLRIVNVEGIISRHLISLVFQRIGNPRQILSQIQFEIDNFFDVPLSEPCELMRFVKILKITYLLVVRHCHKKSSTGRAASMHESELAVSPESVCVPDCRRHMFSRNHFREGIRFLCSRHRPPYLRLGFRPHGNNAGRTASLSLLTLLPLLLTEPSLLTFAALLELLPGDRSHHQQSPV